MAKGVNRGKERMISTSISFPISMLTELEDISEQEKTSVSELVRCAVGKMFENKSYISAKEL